MKFRYKETRRSKISTCSDLFDEFIATFNLKTDFSIETLRKEWSETVGPILSVHTVPQKLENEILFISSDHPVFSNDIVMMKGDIIEKISSLYGERIRDIRVMKKKR